MQLTDKKTISGRRFTGCGKWIIYKNMYCGVDKSQKEEYDVGTQQIVCKGSSVRSPTNEKAVFLCY